MTHREYDGRAADYVHGRPTYPPAVVDVVRARAGVAPPAVVADVGAGTGLLGAAFVAAGFDVVGLEPNDDMRAALARVQPRIRAVAGTAEHTTLDDRSVDVWVAGQAFHWFDARAAGDEARRVLRGPGHVALVWNHLDHASPASDALRRVLRAHERTDAARGAMSVAKLTTFLGHADYARDELRHRHALDRDALRARAFSSDLLPRGDDARAVDVVAAIDALFAAHAEDGAVTLDYVCEIVTARLT